MIASSSIQPHSTKKTLHVLSANLNKRRSSYIAAEKVKKEIFAGIEQYCLRAPRGRTESDYPTYKSDTLGTIQELDNKLESEKVKMTIKKLKNQKSAYVSRLIKRGKNEYERKREELLSIELDIVLNIVKKLPKQV